MTKRQLSKNELKFANQNLQHLKEEIEYAEVVDLARIQLILDTAELSVKKQLKFKEAEKKKLVLDISELKETITTLQDQIDNGVEEIEEEKEKGGK